MTTYMRKVLLNSLKAFDLFLTMEAFLLATYLALPQQSALSLTEFLSMRIRLVNFVLFAGLMVMWHLAYATCGLYNSRRMLGCLADIRDVIKACIAGVVLIGVTGFAFHVRMFSEKFLLIFWVSACAASIASRLVIRATLQQARKHGLDQRNILIVGTGPRACKFAKTIESRPELGYHIMGYVDQQWPGLETLIASGESVVADFEGLDEFLRTNIVDEVVIALPFRSLHSQAAQVAAACEVQGITIRVLSNVFDLTIVNSRSNDAEAGLLMTHYTGLQEGWRTDAKRLFDIVASSILLLIASPLLLLIAALIKLTDPGPVFFAQSRVGLSKRRFKMYKFRTMVVNAEQRMRQLEHLNEVSGPVFKLKDDPRITPFGKLLRKSSLDELPQLINVLKGEMSLVGPRPLPVRDYEGFNQDWQRRRFSVRPGLTCLWQIAGRSSIPFETWMELDLQYIDRWSFWLDMQILARTIPAVLRGFGAF
jgi:exopolysaccharide biosynthesis polyprenyl glycosylphosphotransferase